MTQEIFGQSKLTMINIWGTFCGPCIQEMPDLGEISRSYDSGEFQMIGLISDVTETGDSKAQEIVQSTQADYTHLVASPDIQRKVLSRVSVVPRPYCGFRRKPGGRGVCREPFKGRVDFDH